MFTLWPFILMSYFHFLNFSSSKAFVSSNRTYYRQHQVVPETNLSWFLYSIDEASRTITNRTNSRGLRTEPWCTPTPTPKISLPLTFTLIVVFSYYILYIVFFAVTIQPSTSRYLGAHQRYLPYHTLQGHFSHAFSISTKAIHKSLFC